MSTRKTPDSHSRHSTVLARLARAYHASTNGFERHTGMSTTRWRLLFLIHGKGECTQRDLILEIGVDPGSITRQIKQLEQEGLVERRAHPDDNRLTLVRLTASGLDTVEQILARRAVFLKAMMKGASVAQINTFLDVLDRIAENLDHQDVMNVLDP